MNTVSLAWTEHKVVPGFCTEGLYNPGCCLFLSQSRALPVQTLTNEKVEYAWFSERAGWPVVSHSWTPRHPSLVFSLGAATLWGCGQAILPGGCSHSRVQARPVGIDTAGTQHGLGAAEGQPRVNGQTLQSRMSHSWVQRSLSTSYSHSE